MPPAGLAAGRERLAFVAEVLVGYQVEVTVRFASRARTRARDPARSHLDRSASFSRPHGKNPDARSNPRRSPLRSLRAQLKSGDVYEGVFHSAAPSDAEVRAESHRLRLFRTLATRTRRPTRRTRVFRVTRSSTVFLSLKKKRE